MDPLRVWGPKVASQIALFGSKILLPNNLTIPHSEVLWSATSQATAEMGEVWGGFLGKILEVFQVLFFIPSKKKQMIRFFPRILDPKCGL